MKILYHHRTLADGAEGIHIREMVKAFRELGHEVKVLGPIGELDTPQSSRNLRIGIIKRMLPGIAFEVVEMGYNLYGYWEIVKAIKRFQPDFIYDRYITFNASSVLAGKRYGLPVLLEVNAPLALERSSQPDERLIFQRAAHWTERWICSHASKTIVVSTPLSEYLQSIGVPKSQLIVMPNGVDPSKFSPQPKSDALLQTLGITADDIIIGFTGVLRSWHGLDLLIQSVGKLAALNLPVFLLIVGDGPLRPNVEAWLSTAGIQECACITGLVPHQEVPQYTNLFDIAVSPKSTFYASPMKIIEYMGMEKAVVVPDLPNFLDIIEPGTQGEVFQDNDVLSLTQVLDALCRDADMRRNLGLQARMKVETRLNWAWNAMKSCELALLSMKESSSTL